MTRFVRRSSFSIAFGQFVREKRRAFDLPKLTQRRLGEKTGISKTTIVDIEHGKGEVRFLNVMSLSRVLGFSLAEVEAIYNRCLDNPRERD